MGLKEIFQRFTKRYESTREGFLYEDVNDEIHIVGFERNAPYAEIPSYINEKPVTILGGLSHYPAEEPKIPETVREIESDTFSSNLYILRIEIPETVQKIGDSVFDFSALEEVVFPKSLDISGCTTMFGSATQLRTVVFPETAVKIPEYMFEHAGIATIQIPEGVTAIEKRAFWQCCSLREVQFPNSLVTIGEMAFCECVELERIILPPNVKKVESGAFADCGNLREVIITGEMPELGLDAFQNCAVPEHKIIRR